MSELFARTMLDMARQRQAMQQLENGRTRGFRLPRWWRRRWRVKLLMLAVRARSSGHPAIPDARRVP